MPQRIVVIDASENHKLGFYRALSSARDLAPEFVDLDAVTTDLLQKNDILLIDLGRKSETSLKKIAGLRAICGNIPVRIVAVLPEKPIRYRYRAIQLGADDYLVTPFHPLDLLIRLKSHFRINEAVNRDGVTVSEPDPARANSTLNSLRQLYRQFPPESLVAPSQTSALLEAVRNFCGADLAMLFAVGEDKNVVLSVVEPKQPGLEQLQLSEKDLPILEKAIRLQKPTVINRSSSANPFTSYLNSMLNLGVRSFLIYPVVPVNTTKALLVVLKTNDQAFNEYHYLFAQSAAQLFYRPFLNGSTNGQLPPAANEAAFRAQLDFLAQVVDQLTFGILVTDSQLQVRFISEQASELLRVEAEKVRYRHLHNVLEKDIVAQLLTSINRSPMSIERPEKELDAPDGQKMLVGFSMQRFTDKMTGDDGYIISMKDITYTKEIQEEMRRVDRLASLGVMASGIAHEIRNPLAGIKAMAQTFEEELEQDDPKHEYVRRIVRLVNRLDDLLRTLFSYAKPPKPDRRLCDMEAGLRDVLSLLRQKIRESDVEILESVESELPNVYVDPNQIQQVLINLILNSVEAIHASGEVHISISLFDPAESAEEVRRQPQLALIKSIPYIRFVISDNGCGIPAENLDHIFNPFYTTKTFGTGLGLSIVYQIVKENEGIIFYESELDKGTCCSLYLPVRHPNPLEK